jgi:toxin ParE1/3/4
LVKWSSVARADLKDIHAFISRDSKYYANQVANEIIDKSEQLELFPNMGRMVEEFNDPNLREIIIYSYRLIYQITSEGLEVVTIVHCRRNYTGD